MLSKLTGFLDATLHHGDETRTILQQRHVLQDVSVDDQDVSDFSRSQRAEFVGASHDFRAGLRGAFDHDQGVQTHVVDEE